MLKRVLSVLAALLPVLLLLTCCSQNVTGDRTVIDPTGDEVTIPDEITGIIARVNTASYVAAMGHADLIKATYKYMANDRWAGYMYPALANAVNLTGSPTAETFYELDANLCIWSDREKNTALREQGISAFTDKPEDMPGTVRTLAGIFGEEEWAEKWVSYYKATLEMIEKRTSGIQEKEVVYYVHGAGNEGIYHTAAGGTISETWILQSGCRYATEGTTGFGIDITPEELISIDPDVIVIGGIYYEEMMDTLENTSALSEIRAVQDDRIYNVPVGLIPWDQYGVEYPLLCLWTAKTVYPEAFEDVDLTKETKSFYADFCGVELSDEDVTYLLEGKAPGGGSLLDGETA